MQRNIIIVVMLAIIIVVLGALFFWPTNNQLIDQNNNQNNNISNQPPAGLEITSPNQGETVSSPLKVSGSVKGEGWTGFEGQLGVVRLFDSTGKELSLGILTATEDWMKLPVNFETTLWFDYPGDGNGRLVFYNENASGEPERNKTFEIPVKLQKSSSASFELRNPSRGFFSNLADGNLIEFMGVAKGYA